MADATGASGKPSVRERFLQGLAATKDKSRKVTGVVSHLAKHKKFTLPTATEDGEYADAEKEFLDIVKYVSAARDHLNSYLVALRGELAVRGLSATNFVPLCSA